MIEQVLVDANVIIGARKGDPACTAVIQDARVCDGRYWVTQKVANEVRNLPPGFGIWPPDRPVGFNAGAMKAYISKEFGGSGGSRKPASEADRDLIQTAAANPRFRVLVSADKDLEVEYYGLPESARKFTLMSPTQFVPWIASHRPR